MPPLNKGVATYHCIQGMYWRNTAGELLALEGNNSKPLPEVWSQLSEVIRSAAEGSWSRLQLPSGKEIKTLQIIADIPNLSNIRNNFPPSYQKEDLFTTTAEIMHDNGLILGMLTSRPKSLATNGFSIWSERFILLETEFQPFATISDASTPWAIKERDICNTIAEIFERKLKNLSKDDQWEVCGRQSFLNRVYGYVEKNLPIQLALPAFPCKSPNPNKVGGIMPDLAEHIAMDVLHDFVKEVNAVYEPGATMWVINDGHVFSDCIGVDDEMIDTYDACMAAIYAQRFPEDIGPVPSIKFKGLKNIFAADHDGFQGLSKMLSGSHKMPHPVKTQLTGDAELCRKLMLGIGGPDRAYIRSLIEQQEPDALQLYRGQTRFMLEDLADIPSVKSLSGKQKKKTAALVAEEMMSRNQAYSNLTELLLPNYVRLSIHAHNNKGPKFAIRLLPKHMVRAIDDLENRFEPVPAYEFQIPTPWHNCCIKVEGDDLIYLARSQVAKKALAGSDFVGSWVDGADGSYYSLKRTSGPATTQAPIDLPKLAIPKLTRVGTQKVTVMDDKKRSIVLVTPIMEEMQSPVIICSPMVGKKNPIVVNAGQDGQRPIVISGSKKNFNMVRSPTLGLQRTKTSVAVMGEKQSPTVTVSPLKRQDTHFVQASEKNKLRFLVPMATFLRSMRSSQNAPEPASPQLASPLEVKA
ncbi:hypothetical protein P153DRAFT_352752 [Dothidotthia symphoricarpi CBS 119687]|uniref:Pyoverdine/dityrosine biosynthesis protein n=1 Tax=Dothidotthia symphoricarpi CBS 119687 TaxID=1392245 RepID=A0A6A6AUE7_9PLEO|nr:uncharacterized protein P153DRAFT_352752 [Dothidotthia symphoricarpi CBS 119687]KAF2134818.1 hypothetical protein P153DRAFT_352752 [Dothidotthia symphoricarpi CBS 119687]